MKVIMVSRTFPAYHPKAGQPTYFVEKILKAVPLWHWGEPQIDNGSLVSIVNSVEPKLHTIRAGNRWKVGDMASLRYWDGKPYGKGVKPVEFAQVEVKQIIPIIIYKDAIIISGNKKIFRRERLAFIAKNDGLSATDLRNWFKMPLKKTLIGQIICWSDKVNY